MLYRLVTLLSFLLGTVAVAEAQGEPAGYWLYVDGVWRGGFARREECEAAGAKTTGKLSECRPLYPRAVDSQELAEQQRQWNEQKAPAEAQRLYKRCNSVRSDRATPALLTECQRLLDR